MLIRKGITLHTMILCKVIMKGRGFLVGCGHYFCLEVILKIDWDVFILFLFHMEFLYMLIQMSQVTIVEGFLPLCCMTACFTVALVVISLAARKLPSVIPIF